MSYVLWVIPDRGGSWTERAKAATLVEVEVKRNRLYDDLGDVSVRALPKGEHPANGGYDVTDPRRATPDTPPDDPDASPFPRPAIQDHEAGLFGVKTYPGAAPDTPPDA